VTLMPKGVRAYKVKSLPPAEKPLGFGFVPLRSEHHFVVTLDSQSALISEHLHYDESEARREVSLALGREDDKIRVVLPILKWNAIAEPVREVFNERLKSVGLPAAKWAKSQTPLSRLLGKELVLLAWAIEDADPGLISNALANWRGLAQEERWWLFTMTNAATGHALHGRNKGWRKAVRFALTENPVSGSADDVSREGLFSLLREDSKHAV
jgi:hypothetical protein